MMDPVKVEYDSIKREIRFPNNVCIKGLCVTESNITACDMLVGMDIISMGDFLVTNKGCTRFAFRVPSEGASPL